ncbi:hypothetical protein M3627_08665 [Psychrobacillus sp. MER TA 171]|nr:hypothetical protein [Psychrobacillus sp. MER TA 171]
MSEEKEDSLLHKELEQVLDVWLMLGILMISINFAHPNYLIKIITLILSMGCIIGFIELYFSIKFNRIKKKPYAQ